MRPAPRRSARLPYRLVAVAFFVVGLATLGDYGLTWDEPESYRASLDNLQVIADGLAGHEVDWPWHELTGYQFVFDTLRGGFARLAGPLLDRLDRLDGRPGELPRVAGEPIAAFHLANLLLAAASLLLLGRLVLGLGGSPRLAGLAALVLALTPKLLAHSQNNPKDGIGLFVALAAVAAGVAAASRAREPRARRGESDGQPEDGEDAAGGSLRREPAGRSQARDAGSAYSGARPLPHRGLFGHLLPWAGAGAVLGLALASSIVSVLVVPVVVVWALTVPAAPGGGSLWRRLPETLAGLAAWGASAGLALLVAWPWLWPAPVERLSTLVERVREFPVDLEVLYLGELYPHADPPWHYFGVSLAAATPLVLLLAAAISLGLLGRALLGRRAGAVGGARRWLEEETAGEHEAVRRGRLRVALLGLLWLAVVLGAEPLTGSRYDGVRHFLQVLGPLALLAGAGLDAAAGFLARLARYTRRRHAESPRPTALAAAVLLALALLLGSGVLAADLVAVHPYFDAYLNRAANRLLPQGSERVMEVEYWGSPYREAARWLGRHAPPGSVVLVPVAPWCAEPFLPPELHLGRQARVRQPEVPHYVVLMPRPTFWNPRLEALAAESEPVFAVRRQKATLVAVYELDPATRSAWRGRPPRGRRGLWVR